MLAIKSRVLTPKIRCEKDRLEGVKRVNASRMQNAMVAFNAVKSAFEKELTLRKTMKDEMIKVVKADLETLKGSIDEKTIVDPEVVMDDTKNIMQ